MPHHILLIGSHLNALVVLLRASMDAAKIQLEPSWKKALYSEFTKPYMQTLGIFLREQTQNKKTIYPKMNEVFAAFNLTPLKKVRVVILGQDPYHGPGQAHGLCFSVQPGTKIPPSLQNIFKEISADLKIPRPTHGHLESWAKQGVLLLNATLSVEHGLAGSHQNKGWETFTDQVIDRLNRERENIVFLLWGSYAQKKGALIDRKKHLVLEAPHPSPLSAHRGFLGCKHFSKTNAYLVKNHLPPIDWSLKEAQ